MVTQPNKIARSKRASKDRVEIRAYVGSFTTAKRRCHGDGIRVYRIAPNTDVWTPIQHIEGLINPSFLIVNRAQSILYVAHGDECVISTYAIDRTTGMLSFCEQIDSGGLNPVRIVFDPTERFLIVANYSSGNIAVLPVMAGGFLGPAVQVITLPGTPRAKSRTAQQGSSHPHDVQFDPSGHFLLAPDKGLDRVFIFRFDAEQGRLSLTDPGFALTRAGAGPRHIAFHPTRPFAWVANELDSTVSVYRLNRKLGSLTPVDVVSTLPGDFVGDSTAAEIAFMPASNTLYVSNRGHDSIALYRVNSRTGHLHSIGWQPSLGRHPRFFSLDSIRRRLIAANEQGDTLASFQIESRTGLLRRVGRLVSNASPVTIAFTQGTRA